MHAGKDRGVGGSGGPGEVPVVRRCQRRRKLDDDDDEGPWPGAGSFINGSRQTATLVRLYDGTTNKLQLTTLSRTLVSAVIDGDFPR